MQDFKQSLVVQAVDKFSAPAKKMAGVSEEFAGELAAGQKAVNDLGKNSRTVSQLQALEKRIGQNATTTAKYRTELKRVGGEMKAGGKVTKKLQREHDQLKRKVIAGANAQKSLKNQAAGMRSELRSAGVDTRNLANAQDELARKTDKAVGKMKDLARVQAGQAIAQKKYDRALQTSANLALVGQGASSFGRSTLNAVASPLDAFRATERGRGSLATLGVDNADAIVNEGRRLQREFAGINAADVVASAYDIKSGIETLSVDDVAKATGLAALTAKATGSDAQTQTSLFATGYGSFKETLFKDASDGEFLDQFAAGIGASVKRFKTNGANMQQAIESMGSGLAASGVELSEQLVGLGLLQQKMKAGEAGTTLNALERSAAKAEDKFAAQGVDFDVLDEAGNLRSLADLLEEAQNAFGEDYTTEVGGKIQEAFGSEEAVKFFKALWGQQDLFRNNVVALKAAQKQGKAFVETMAKAADNNADSRIVLMQQRWQDVQHDLGKALLPVLERMIPVVEAVVGGVGALAQEFPGLTTMVVGGIAVVGGLTAILGPVLTGIAALNTSLAITSRAARSAAGGLRSSGGYAGGGRRGRGLLGKFGGGKSLLKRAGIVGGAISAASIGSTLLDDNLSTKDKVEQVAGDGGALAGGLAGAAAGAAMGSVVPVIGTAIGGIIGGIVGGVAGEFGGGALGSWLGSFFENDAAAEAGQALASTLPEGPSADGVTTGNQVKNENTIHVYPASGMDEEALAGAVVDEFGQLNDHADGY
jgi:TP901 family phage tail tape measure protein